MDSILSHIERVTEQLKAKGLQAGDRVALQGPARYGWVVTVLACWKLRIVVVPLSLRYRSSQLDEACRTMRCHRLLRGADLADFTSDTLGGITWTQLDLDLVQDASLILTSGSAGSPKGVLHTLGNHVHSAVGSEDQIPFGKDDTWLVSLPLYHIGGFSLVMRALLHGGRLRFLRPGETLATALQSTPEFTHLSVVPTQLRDLLDDPACHAGLQRLQAILVGGAQCPTPLLQRSMDLGLKLYVSYGSTEMASQITTTPVNIEGHLGCVLPYRELRISNQNEIWVRGETRFKGYWTRDGLDTPFDQDGWFATGDLGCLDNRGNLMFTGRKDTMFISGGENIYPEEIERALIPLDGIKRCLVVPVPSDRYGQRPVAFVETHEGQMLDERRLRESLRNLESFKIPDRFLPWPTDLPEGIKIRRRDMARRAQGGSL